MKFTRLIVPVAIALIVMAFVLTSSPPPATTPTGASPAATAQPAASTGPVNDRDLAPKWNAGDSRRYLVFTRTEAENTTPGQNEPIRNSSELFLVFTIECVERTDSVATLTLTYERIRSTFRSPRVSLRSDTARDTDPGPDFPADRINSSIAYMRTIGVPVTITLDDKLALQSATHNPDDFDDTIAALRVGLYLLGTDGIRNTFSPIFAHTTEQADTGLNEPWIRYEQYEGPASNRWIDAEHTVIESANGLAEIALTATVQSAPYTEEVPDPDDAPEFPNLEGVYTWDIRDGSLLQAELLETFDTQEEVQAGVHAAVMGETASVTTRGQTTTVIQRVDENFSLDELLAIVAKVEPALGPRPENAANLDAEVNRARQQLKAPALGVAVVNAEGIVAFGIIGERNADTGAPIRTDDLFNLGFVSSNVTATSIAALVTDGAIAWDDAFSSEQVPGLTPAFENATLAQLLAARAGVPGFNAANAPEYAALGQLTGDATQQRLSAARRILSAEPASPVGAYSTSAASTSLAVALAEQTTGESWDDLAHNALLAPLRLFSARADWPATSATPEQPQGHVLAGQGFAPVAIGRAPAFDALRRPSTGLSMNLQDFATYAAHELRALNGQSDIVSRENARRVHDAPDGRVGMYWVRVPTPTGYDIHWNGSMAGGFTSAIVLVPDLELGVVVVTNAGNALNGARDFAFDLLKRDPRLGGGTGQVGPRVTPTIE